MSVPSSTVIQYYEGVLRLPPSSEVVANLSQLANTSVLLQTLLNQATISVDPIIRIYQAAFDRVPDSAGLTFQVENFVNGGAGGLFTVEDIANAFVSTPEFQAQYGSLSDALYVSALYANVLGRTAAQAEIDYWVNFIDEGHGRGTVLYYFSESAEFKAICEAPIDNFETRCALNTESYSGPLVEFAGATYQLTTQPDTFLGTINNDTFNAGLAGPNNTSLTLNSLDSLDGAAGTDTINIELYGNSANPQAMSRIEIFNTSNLSATAATLNMINADSETDLVNMSSVGNLSFTNVTLGADTSLTVTDTTATTNLVLTGTSGSADQVDVEVDNVTANAAISIAGVEQIDLYSGSAANAIYLDAASLATLNVTGNTDLTVGATAGSHLNYANYVNASDFTGSLTYAADNAASTLIGGSGNDVLTGGSSSANVLSGNAGNDNLIGGSAADSIVGGSGANTLQGATGNDTLVGGDDSDIIYAGTSSNVTGLTIADSIVGGSGADTLVASEDDIYTISSGSTAASISGVETLNITTAATQAYNIATRISTDINTINLVTGAAGATFNLNAGASTINVGGALAGNVTFNAAGTGSSDALTVVNTAASGNVFHGDSLAATGYETVTINNGAYATPASTTLTTVDIGTTAALNLTGNNTLAITNATAASLDASGMATTGALTMTTAATSLVNIVGSAGADTLVTSATSTTVDGGNGADTINGGAGNDSLVGGSGDDVINTSTGNNTVSGGVGADSITAGAGNDYITGGDDNDTIKSGGGADTIYAGSGADTVLGNSGSEYIDGEAGADTITASTGNDTIMGGADNDLIIMGDALTSADSINGGDGALDTLSLYAAVTSPTVGGNIVNIEGITANATGINQDLSQFTNLDVTTLGVANTGSTTFTNAEAVLSTLDISGAGSSVTAVTASRLASSTTDALTVNLVGNTTVTTLTLNDEDTVTLGSTISAATVTNLSASSLDTLEFGGASALTVVASTLAELDTISVSNTSTTGVTTLTAVNLSEITVGGTGAGALTIGTLTNASAASLALNATTNNITVTTASAAQVDALTISNVSNVVYGGSTLAAADLDTITVGSGAGAVTIGSASGNTTLTTLSSIDATNATGAVKVYAGTSIQNATVAGGSGADVFVTGSGLDSIVGGSGADSISSGAGADSIFGGAGADTIIGGSGADYIDLGASDAAADRVTQTAASSQVVATTSTTTVNLAATALTSVDIVVGAATNDTIYTNSSSNATLTAVSANTFDTATDVVNFVVGDFNEDTGIFAYNASGTDTLYVYSTNGSDTSYEALVVLNFVGTSTAISSGLITL